MVREPGTPTTLRLGSLSPTTVVTTAARTPGFPVATVVTVSPGVPASQARGVATASARIAGMNGQPKSSAGPWPPASKMKLRSGWDPPAADNRTPRAPDIPPPLAEQTSAAGPSEYTTGEAGAPVPNTTVSGGTETKSGIGVDA